MIPFLGPFHTQVSFISATNKRFSGSGLSDITESENIITDKSVDQALQGKHYKRAVRALQLVYEVLQRRIVKVGLENGLSISKEIQELFNTLTSPINSTKRL